MGLRDPLYWLYERRLERKLGDADTPRHVGVILDGNRRWARISGLGDVNRGHQAGADKIFELLGWCSERGVQVVTLWLLSTDNLGRPREELEPLLRIIENTVIRLRDEGWNVNPMGALDLLPDSTARVMKEAGAATSGKPA